MLDSVFSRRTLLARSAACATAAAVGALTLGSCAKHAALSSATKPTAIAALVRNPFIDTHVHFYDPTRPQGVPWPTKSETQLYRTVMPKDYAALPGACDGVIAVEASSWVEDNQWLLDLAAREPLIVGVCGNLTPGDAEFAQHLSRFAKNPLFRGIRISGDGWRKKIVDPTFLGDLKRLADANLQLDVNCGREALPDLARLADRVPTLRMVLDHCANTPISGWVVPADWLAGMTALGGRPNIWAKLSGLVENAEQSSPPTTRPAGFYDRVLDAMWNIFGEDHLIYGSNWPVSGKFASLHVVRAVVSDFLASKGGSGAKVFGPNAKAVYRWSQR